MRAYRSCAVFDRGTLRKAAQTHNLHAVLTALYPLSNCERFRLANQLKSTRDMQQTELSLFFHVRFTLHRADKPAGRNWEVEIGLTIVLSLVSGSCHVRLSRSNAVISTCLPAWRAICFTDQISRTTDFSYIHHRQLQYLRFSACSIHTSVNYWLYIDRISVSTDGAK